MVRVLHIVSAMNRGGIETFIMNVYRHINRDEIQFDFLLSVHERCDYSDEIENLGGRIYNICSCGESLIKRWVTLNSFFLKHREYRIVHQHASSLVDILPLIAAKKMGIPVRIMHSHNIKVDGVWFRKYIHYFNRLFINKYATDLYACSESAAIWMYGLLNRNKYKIIYNGIDLNTFRYNQNAAAVMRKKFEIDDDDLVIGHVGRFHPMKNHLFLLKVFEKILSIIPSAHLVLVGDGPLRPNIEKSIRELGLDNAVILTGVRDDVNNIMSMFDVLCLPSLYEGLGIVLIEAQAMGISCVVSSVVPQEAKVLDSFKYVSLSSSELVWADTIIIASQQLREQNAIQMVRDAKFDIKEVSILLKNKYLAS